MFRASVSLNLDIDVFYIGPLVQILVSLFIQFPELAGYVHTVDTQMCYMARFGNTADVARF